MTTTNISTVKRGGDLAIGDSVIFMGATHRISTFKPYAGALLHLLGEGTRIAIAEGGHWSITVPPSMPFEVAS